MTANTPLDSYIEKLVASWPPLNASQRSALALIFGGATDQVETPAPIEEAA